MKTLKVCESRFGYLNWLSNVLRENHCFSGEIVDRSYTIFGEVLEHLDDSVAFLRGLCRNMAPGAKAFITAALNAAHADHIYMYRKSDEVLTHLNEAGFTLEQSFVGTVYKHSVPGVPVPEAAAFIVY